MVGELTIDYQTTIWSIGQNLESPAVRDIRTRIQRVLEQRGLMLCI